MCIHEQRATHALSLRTVFLFLALPGCKRAQVDPTPDKKPLLTKDQPNLETNFLPADDTKAEIAIKAIGGTVGRDDKANGKPIRGGDLTGPKVTDAALKELAGLKNLKFLGLSQSMVTDAGLKDIARFSNLEHLDLAGTKVTNIGLKELAGFKNLQFLSLHGTAVMDAGLKELAGLKNLKTLELSFTQAGDVGVKEVDSSGYITSIDSWLWLKPGRNGLHAVIAVEAPLPPEFVRTLEMLRVHRAIKSALFRLMRRHRSIDG